MRRRKSPPWGRRTGAYEGWYDVTMEEGVERAALLTCGRVMDATSRVDRCFRMRLPKTSSEGDASIIEPCVIEDGKAYGEEEIATDNRVRTEVAMDKSSVIDGANDFTTPVLETSAVVLESQHETRETEGGGRKAED